MTRLYSVKTKRQYTDKKGNVQTEIYKVGFIRETESGAKYLWLYQQPNTRFYIVPQDAPRGVIQLD